MYELSIALSILDWAEEERQNRGGRVTAIHVKLGRLSGVVSQENKGVGCRSRGQQIMPADSAGMFADIARRARCGSRPRREKRRLDAVGRPARRS
jgi:hypothetical protein